MKASAIQRGGPGGLPEGLAAPDLSAPPPAPRPAGPGAADSVEALAPWASHSGREPVFFRADAFARFDPIQRVGIDRPGIEGPGIEGPHLGGGTFGLDRLQDYFAMKALRDDPAFAALPASVQDRMLALAEKKPRPLAGTFRELAADPAFKALSAGTQGAAVEQLGKHGRDAAATSTLRQLVASPGFAQLTGDEQDRLLRYVGGTNKFVSEPARRALDGLLKGADFTGADAAGQGAKLRDFLTKQADTPYLASSNGASLSRAAYTVSEGTDVKDFGFTSGKADGVSYQVTIGDKSITVTMPKNVPAGANLPSLDDVAKGLAALPAGSRAVVQSVVVEPGQNPKDAEWAMIYGTPGFRSYMTAGAAGIVTIYPTTSPQTQTFMEQSLVHETGHVLSKKSWGEKDDPRWNEWKQAVAKDGIYPSGYGKNSNDEDFAETLVIYANVKGTPAEAEMRALMPERFKLLDRLLGG
jgi:hypothetical protein